MENSVNRRLHICLAVCVACTVGAAWVNYGWYHPDEYFQTIEYASFKLGITKADSLPWEFGAQVRPWLQPAMYYTMLKGMAAAGMEDRFVMTFVLRLFGGLMACLALFLLTGLSMRWCNSDDERRLQAFVPLLCFFPILMTRTSSESLSATAFVLGFVLLMRDYTPEAPAVGRGESPAGGPHPRIFTLFASGAIFGLAFEFRYQTALMTGGLIVWMLFVKKEPLWRALVVCGGVAAVIAVCFFIDNWGYGETSFPLFNYFIFNILQGKAVQFGSSPFYAYIYLVMANPVPLLGLFLLAVMFLSWYRRPRHPVTWVVFPFFLFHCVVAHKEDRFLFPVLPLISVMIIPALSPGNGKPIAILERMFRPAHSWLWKTAFAANIACLFLLSFLPITVESHFYLQRHIYKNGGKNYVLHTYGFDPYRRWVLEFSFYKPAGYRSTPVKDARSMSDLVDDTPGPLHVSTPLPFIEPDPREYGASARLETAFCTLPCMSESVLAKLKPLLAALHGLSPENISWAAIFEVTPSGAGK